MPILDRYLLREVARPLPLALVVLVVVFAGYSAASFLARAASGLLGTDVVVRLILLRTVVALEQLLPMAVYLTVVAGLGRLAGTRELTAMSAVGFGERRVLRALAGPFVAVAAVSGVLSLWARPAAYTSIYRERARAEASIDLGQLRAGRFYQTGDGERVVFVDELDAEGGVLRGVFVWLDRGRSSLVLCAERVTRVAGTEGRPTLEVRGLRAWELDEGGGALAMSADRLVTDLDLEDAAAIGHERKAAPLGVLIASGASKDLAELQWRVSRPLSALLLCLLGVVLALRPPGGRARRGRVVTATLVYVVYYQLCIMAKNWVEDGVVGPFPGLWWVDAALAGIVLGALVGGPWLRRRRPAGGAG